MRKAGRVSKKVFLVTLITLTAIIGIPLTLGVHTYNPSSFGPSKEQVEEDMRRLGYVLSHMDEILERLRHNDTFKELVKGRRWELGRDPAGIPLVGLGQDDYTIHVHILDDEGNIVRGITIYLDLDLKIIGMFDWPIIRSHPPIPSP